MTIFTGRAHINPNNEIKTLNVLGVKLSDIIENEYFHQLLKYIDDNNPNDESVQISVKDLCIMKI